MKSATIVGVTRACVVVAVLSAVSSVHAQGPADMPENALPEVRTGSPLGAAPAEQFAACSGIADLQERERCIERETAKSNPATRSTQGNSIPELRKGDSQSNDHRKKSNGR